MKEYKKVLNVLVEDPELLPALPQKHLNRSQFAYEYLRAMLHDREKNLTYIKNKNVTVLQHPSYFRELKKRLETTKHITSFSTFIEAFM